MSTAMDDLNKRLFATEEESDELESSLDIASKRDPDAHVQNLSLANNHELPVETVSRNVDEVKRREMLTDMGINTMRDAYPKTSQYLSDPDNASVSIDDVLGLKDFETALKDNERGFWSNAAKGGLNRVNTLTGNLIEFTGNVSDDLTDYMVNTMGIPNPGIIIGDDGVSWSWDIPTEMPDIITHVGKAVSEGEAYDYKPTFTWENLKGDVTPTNLAGYITEQGVQSLPDMLAALFTLPAYVASRTEEIAEERVANDKRDEVTAGDLMTSVVPATAVALMERLGAKVTFGLGKTIGAKGVVKAATGAAVVEGGTEFIQEGIEYLGETAFTKKPVSFMEMLDRQFAGLVAGSGIGVGVRGTTATIEAIGNKSAKQMRIDAMSEAEQNTIDEIISYSQSSKTRERSAEHFEKFVESVGADRSVLIPEEHLQGLEGLPSYILEQIDGTGTDVSIPLAKFASEIAPNEELMAAIRPHIRLSDSTLSQAELETGDRSQVEQMISNAQEYQDTLTEADRVYETVKEQLVATGMQSDVTARYSAQLYPAAATVYVEKARKLGHDITVEEAFNAMGFQVRAERVAPEKADVIYDQKDRPVITDDKGEPIRVFRGEHGKIEEDQIIQTRSGSITFSPNPETASGYAEVPNRSADMPISPRVIPAYISMKNPIMNDPSDPFMDLQTLVDVIGFDKTATLANEYAEQIMNTNNWEENFEEEFGAVNEVIQRSPERLGELYLEAYHILDDSDAIAALKDAGYDGAVYGGSGISAMEAEYRVFDESQIVFEKPKMEVDVEAETYFQSAQENDLGLYSAVEQAVIDMKLPVWKKGITQGFGVYPPLASGYAKRFDTREEAESEAGKYENWEVRELTGTTPASNKEIWGKLKSMPGIKKEEIEWLGIEEYLQSKGDKGKFTREEVIAFIQENGVTVEETVAGEVGAPEGEMDWDNGVVWDDPEAWGHNTEEMLYDFDKGESETSFYAADGITEWMDEWIDNNRQSVIDNYYDALPPDQKSDIDELDSLSEKINYIMALDDTDPHIEMRSEARDDYEERSDQLAREAYEEDPQYIYTAKGIGDNDLYIFGSDDLGYTVRRDNWELHSNAVRGQEGDIYSVAEAQIQAEDFAREEGWTVDEESEEAVRWEEYVMEGEHDNYREIKLKLPDIDPEFYETAHFPDANVVAFLRVDDRQLAIEPKPRGITYDADIEKQNLKELSYDDALTFYKSARGVVLGTPTDTGYNLTDIRKDLTDDRFKMLFSKDKFRFYVRTGDAIPKNTYFIDEFQSDWHQKGRQEGYATGKVDAGELDVQANELYSQMETMLQSIDKDLTPVEFENNIINVEARLTQQQDERRTSILGKLPENFIPDYEKLRDQRSALLRQAQAERGDIPDAPFKGDAWLQLGLKRAVLDAVENNYEAIAWPNAQVLMDRWSSSYEEMYKNQYDRKMPSAVKKLTKEKPVLLSMEGKPVEHEELGYWIIPITDKLKERVSDTGFTLFQDAQEEAIQRASIQFTEDNESIIRLTRASDLSSFLHESGHLFLEMEKRFAAKYGASDEMRPLLDWLGVDDLENLTIEHHEKFAETFEVYLREGKSPSLKLRDAFAAFARWLSVIYRKITDPRLGRAELTPEIREYMDRMLATEIELEQAAANPMYDQFFESKEAAGMTQEQWEKYLNQRDKVKTKASVDLIDKAMNELRKRKTKEWKEEREPLIDEELDRLSKERAYAILEETAEFPMDYAIVMEELGLEKQPGKLIGKLKKEGTDPGEYAEVYGYNSVKEMIEDIISVPSIKKAATDAAEARMIDKYGDILNDGTLELEARESLHNDEQAKVLIQELRVLSKGKPAIDREYLKAKAKETMESMKYKEIKPNKYYRAEITAAKKSVTAKTDAEKLTAKTQQIVNHYLYREAIKYKEKMDKQRKYVRTVQKREYKARDVVPDFSQNMRTLANLYDLRNKVDQIRDVTMLLQWYDAQLADENKYVEIGMLDPNLVLALEARTRGELPLLKLPTFDDLTASDLQGLYDNLRHLRYVGGQLAKGEKGELALEIRSLAEHIELQGGRSVSGTRGIPTKHENLKRQVQTMINKVPSLRNLIRKIDGFEEDGMAYRMIYRVIEDANSHKLQLARETYDRFNDELDGIHKVGLNRTNTQDYTLESGDTLTIHPESRFMMAMYWGIESSREAIREGFGVTDADVMTILSDMTQEQLELVNATWKINESMWPELSEAHVKLVGVAPPKLDPVSFEVNGVKMTGGHMRLFYDSSEIELKALQENTGGYASIMPTKAGSLHARVGSGGRPPALDKNNIVRSLEDNLHYIAFAGASNRIRSFINSRDVKGAIERKHGVGFYNALLETIDGITGDRKQREQIPALASMFRLLRRAATFKHLAYSIRNTVQQVTAIPVAMEEVGMVDWTNQLIKFASPEGHKEIVDFVTDRSEFMANRASLVNREAAEYLRTISVEGEFAHMWTQFARFGFTPQTIIDSIIAFPVWMAKYEQEINEHADEAKAASAADSSVAESVGSGADLHLGGVFHSTNSEFVRMFTIFGTWFNAYYQRIYKSTKGFDDLANAEAVKSVIVTPFIVGVLAALVVMDGPADDEDYWVWAMKRYGAFMAGTVPILRDIVGAFSGFAPKTVFSGGGEAPAKLAGELKALAEGKQTPLKATSDITKIVTGIVPVPGAGNITRVMDYIDSYNRGREGSFNAYQAVVEGPQRNK